MKQTTSIKDLKKVGYTLASCPSEVSASITRAFTWWEAFCALSKEARLKFPYQNGVGYELKETPGATRDLKEDFHFTEDGANWLTATAGKMSDASVAKFVESAKALVPLISPMVLQFASEVERAHHLHGFADEVASGQGKWIIRFLHYFGGRTEGEETATAHADKSGFTLSFPSTPGLERLAQDGKWWPMSVPEGQILIHPSMQLQYRSRGELKALCHRVVATPATAVEGRFSMVCFIPLVGTASYNKKGAGRLQEFAPGFNYTMPFTEFEKLFVKE
jgi:isopenicillin N synthase-like dioxygenase